MKHASMILSMVIPGKHMLGNDIDVYLPPLVKDLKELWFDGIEMLDASTKQIFVMRAAIMWTISDFPGLGNFSGWNTYTTLACPTCNFYGSRKRLRHRKKNCFMGHRSFSSSGSCFSSKYKLILTEKQKPDLHSRVIRFYN